MAYIGANPQISLQEYLTIDDISGDFDGAETSFALLVGGVAPVPGPKQSNQLLISLNGVIQEPDDTGSAGFRLSGGNIIFSSAPSAATPFFGVALAGADYVYAGTNFPDGSVTSPSITFANDLDSGFYRTGSGELAYTSNGTFRLKIDSSGRLGVGTSSPSTKLHVSSTDSSATYLRVQNTSGQALFGVDNSGNAYAGAESNDAFGLYTDGTYRMYITSVGDVGIGTTSPGLVGGLSKYLTLASTGSGEAVGLELVGNRSSGDETAARISFINSSAEIARINCSYQDSTTLGSLEFYTSGSEKARIDSSGRLGLGTTGPQHPLHVVGTSLVTGDAYFGASRASQTGYVQHINIEGTDCSLQLYQTTTNSSWEIANDDTGLFRILNGGTDRFAIDSSGNVGIGTTSPGAILEVVAASGQRHLRVVSHSSGDSCLRSVYPGDGNFRTISLEGSTVDFYTGDTTTGTLRARIDQNGLSLGISNQRSDFFNSTTVRPTFQIEGAGTDNRIASIVSNNTVSGAGAVLVLGHEKSGATGGDTAVANDDLIGRVSFQGNDGSTFVEAAVIEGYCDGAVGTDDMPGRLTFSTTADGASSPTEHVRLERSGRFICGRNNRNATGADAQLLIEGSGYSAFHYLDGSAYLIGQNSNSRNLRIGSGSGYDSSGVQLAAGGTSWGTYSDERLKNDIVELTNCLDTIKGIRCVSYHLADIDEADSKKRLGVIAQDLVGKYDEVLDSSKRTDKDDTEYLSVRYTELIPVLLKALQEATVKIETLEQRLNDAGIA